MVVYTRLREAVDAWYVSGVSAAGASCVTYPLDLIRVQMQARLHKITVGEVISTVMRKKGYLGFYNGLRTNIQRQFTYNATRFGIYEGAKAYGMLDSFWRKVLISSFGGLVAGFVNSPLVQVDVRTRMDVVKAPHKQRNYKHIADGVRQLYKEGGSRFLLLASVPSSLRGMLYTASQLAVFDQVKAQLLQQDKHGDNWHTFFMASVIAGGSATLITTPMEVIKAIYMDSNANKYRNSWHVAQQIIKLNGYQGFYKGLAVTFIRFVPQTFLTMFFYEMIVHKLST